MFLKIIPDWYWYCLTNTKISIGYFNASAKHHNSLSNITSISDLRKVFIKKYNQRPMISKKYDKS